MLPHIGLLPHIGINRVLLNIIEQIGNFQEDTLRTDISAIPCAAATDWKSLPKLERINQRVTYFWTGQAKVFHLSSHYLILLLCRSFIFLLSFQIYLNRFEKFHKKLFQNRFCLFYFDVRFSMVWFFTFLVYDHYSSWSHIYYRLKVLDTSWLINSTKIIWKKKCMYNERKILVSKFDIMIIKGNTRKGKLATMWIPYMVFTSRENKTRPNIIRYKILNIFWLKAHF